MEIESLETEIFCGVARLPREMAAMEPNSFLAVELAVNVNTGIIADVACTSFPVLGERMVHDYLIGKPLAGALVDLAGNLESRYHGTGKRAMIAALGNAAAAYDAHSRSRATDSPLRDK